jgi:teichuronic acid biosynthesis glycosyltransferase TuaC
MRVVVFSSLYPNNVWPSHGVFVKERMTNFARLTGCEVKVVAPVPYFPALNIGSRWQYSQVAAQETIDGIDVFHPRYFITPKIGMTLYGWLMFCSVLPKMKALKQRYPFDMIDAHFLYPDGFAATLLGRALQTPVVVSARGNDVLLYARFPLIRPFLRKTLRAANQAIAVSQELKDAMVGVGGRADKIRVIPNGVDSEKFHAISREEARVTLGLPQKKTILSAGHLIPRKGFDRLLVAVRDVCTSQPSADLQVVIVGEGPLRKELEGMVATLGLSGRVRFAGHVPHHELAVWYSAADVFCLFSRQEGCPNVVLEALACGTPVVATPVGEVPAILSSEEIGLVAEPEAPVLAQQLARALEKPWSAHAIRACAKGYSWEGVTRALGEVFHSAVMIGTKTAYSSHSMTSA